jgi:hypothetical protein
MKPNKSLIAATLAVLGLAAAAPASAHYYGPRVAYGYPYYAGYYDPYYPPYRLYRPYRYYPRYYAPRYYPPRVFAPVVLAAAPVAYVAQPAVAIQQVAPPPPPPPPRGSASSATPPKVAPQRSDRN